MAKILGLDLGTDSIGWALIDTQAHQIPDSSSHKRRRLRRSGRRKKQRMAHRSLIHRRHYFSRLLSRSAFIDKIKTSLPFFINVFLAILLTFAFLMAAFTEEFQYWFNIAITILIGWIALRKDSLKKN